MTETRETMIKRLKMRSMRRGIKEMDLILSAFADLHLAAMDAGTLDLYDRLLAENDHDIYQWITGQMVIPDHYKAMIGLILAGAQNGVQPA